MLTALTIENKVENIWYKRFVNSIIGDDIKVSISSARGVALRHITYINRKNKINWEKISQTAGQQKNEVLCNEDTPLFKGCGIRRFYSSEFAGRLCVNMLLHVLSKADADVRELSIGLYDLKGEHTDILKSLLKYSSNVKVVTNEAKRYADVAEVIMEEQGASVMISKNEKYLSKCFLVIAPDKILNSIPVAQNAILFTCEKPAVCLNGLVYYRYFFKMPNKFGEIKPKELSYEYFASALYTKGRQYELGSIIPTMCYNESSSQTIYSLVAYINNMCSAHC